MDLIDVPCEFVPGFEHLGVTAFTTTRAAGSFNLGAAEPVAEVFGRWMRLAGALGPGVERLAVAHQVHGNRILVHGSGWCGFLRDTAGADGHFTMARGTAMAVTLADCVPVFMAHPAGVVALLHSGWRGTAAGILPNGIRAFAERGCAPKDLVIHLGPAICGDCYEVGPEVHEAVTGESVNRPTRVDLRAALARQAERAGATATISAWCTRHDNERFFSHRAGDSGRHVAVIALAGQAAPAGPSDLALARFLDCP